VDVEVGLNMASGRIRRTARRGVAPPLLVWLGMAGVAVLMAPSASAAPTATVTIRDLTPPAVSVDAGGTVTFVNGIADKTLPLVGVVHTEVTLGLPSGAKPPPARARVSARRVTSVNGIPNRTLPLVGVVPPEVPLGLPSGAKPLPAGARVSERFGQ